MQSSWHLGTHSFSCLWQLKDAEDEATLQTALDAMNKEFEKLSEINWMNSIIFPEVHNLEIEIKGKREFFLSTLSSSMIAW